MARKWNSHETELLKKLYPTAIKEELEKKLNRNMSAITFKANSLNLKRQQYWTKKEEELLKTYYSGMSEDELSELLGRSVASIRNKASRLNIKKHYDKPKSKPWSQKEINKLNEMYPKASKTELEQTFDRSINAIRNKAFQLNIKREN